MQVYGSGKFGHGDNPEETGSTMWELACVEAGLARDAGTAVCQSHRGDAIAGKPAPTQARCHRQMAYRI
ncbi:hypothetical protein F7R12_16075 [Pseudomonas tolaasii]|nr:hypothetical protein F7R12_16075 [Pseudomonas tolaasii]